MWDEEQKWWIVQVLLDWAATFLASDNNLLAELSVLLPGKDYCSCHSNGMFITFRVTTCICGWSSKWKIWAGVPETSLLLRQSLGFSYMRVHPITRELSKLPRRPEIPQWWQQIWSLSAYLNYLLLKHVCKSTTLLHDHRDEAIAKNKVGVKLDDKQYQPCIVLLNSKVYSYYRHTSKRVDRKR